VAELNAVWRGLAALQADADAAPAHSAKVRFQEMVAAYQAGMAAAQPGVRQVPRPGRAAWFTGQPVWQFAAAAGLLLGGILFGRYLPPSPAAGNTEMTLLRAQVENLRQTVALSMLQQQSPSARMRGVTYSEKIAQPDRNCSTPCSRW